MVLLNSTFSRRSWNNFRTPVNNFIFKGPSHLFKMSIQSEFFCCSYISTSCKTRHLKKRGLAWQLYIVSFYKSFKSSAWILLPWNKCSSIDVNVLDLLVCNFCDAVCTRCCCCCIKLNQLNFINLSTLFFLARTNRVSGADYVALIYDTNRYVWLCVHIAPTDMHFIASFNRVYWD